MYQYEVLSIYKILVLTIFCFALTKAGTFATCTNERTSCLLHRNWNKNSHMHISCPIWNTGKIHQNNSEHNLNRLSTVYIKIMMWAQSKLWDCLQTIIPFKNNLFTFDFAFWILTVIHSTTTTNKNASLEKSEAVFSLDQMLPGAGTWITIQYIANVKINCKNELWQNFRKKSAEQQQRNEYLKLGIQK